MVSLPGYDNWKTSPPEPPDVVQCEYCGDWMKRDDAVDYRDMLVCSDCLSNLEADDEELEDYDAY